MRVPTLLLTIGLLTIGLGVAPHVFAQTFSKDVAPVLQKNCQECHRPGQAAPFSMLTYEQVRPWAKAIKAAVIQKKMPPWFADPAHGTFLNDRSLTQAEIDTFKSWTDNGTV